MTTTSPAPAVILVRPQLGENIGACARAMLNFGLDDLRLVAPRDGWPNPDAWPRASGADRVLENAKLFDTLPEALADLHMVYATTVRPRDMIKPVVTAAGAAAEIRGLPAPSGLMFGPERTGLATDEVALAHAILTVPVNPDFSSLNLAQAVLLAAYEWHKAGDATPARQLVNHDGPAANAELERLVAAVDAVLEAADYYNVPHRIAQAKRNVRSLLTRPGFSDDEIRTWRGILHALAGKRRPKVESE